MTSPQEQSQEVQKYMDDLTRVTREGTIQWKAVNPTTYLWEQTDSQGNGARLILQRIEQPIAPSPVRVATRPGMPAPPVPMRISFNLQGFEIKPTNQAIVKIALSGASDNLINQKLGELFDTIIATIAQQGLDFLRNFIPKPKA